MGKIKTHQEMKKCSVQDCDEEVCAKGMCDRHYRQVRTKGRLREEPRITQVKLCSVEGCGRAHYGLGFCRDHYAQNKRNNETRKCKVDGCENKYFVQGYCWYHSRQFNDNIPKCSVENCENKVHKGDLCKLHLQQIKTHGAIIENPRTQYDPNELFIEENICKIQIYNMKHHPTFQAIIDVEDVPKIVGHKWSINKNYEISNEEFKYLSRVVLNITDPLVKVDHINRNRLDNRKENLRPCTNAENCRNRGKPKNNTSGYKGVFWHCKNEKWIASIGYNNRSYYLGSYNTKEDAAKAYNQAAKLYHGEFAVLNVIEEDEDEQ
jgi:hypothetical protein